MFRLVVRKLAVVSYSTSDLWFSSQSSGTSLQSNQFSAAGGWTPIEVNIYHCMSVFSHGWVFPGIMQRILLMMTSEHATHSLGVCYSNTVIAPFDGDI
jgi:hypothetical protein